MRILSTVGVLLLAASVSAQVSTRPPQSGGGGGGGLASPLAAPTGCVSPPYSFTADTDAGLCLSAANDVRLQTGDGDFPGSTLRASSSNSFIQFRDGSGNTTSFTVGDNIILGTNESGQSFSFGATAFTNSLVFQVEDGSSSAPAYSFSNDTDTGMYQAAADKIGWAYSGFGRMFLSTAGLQVTPPILAGGPSSGIPSYSFFDDQDTGWHNTAGTAGANTVVRMSGGEEYLRELGGQKTLVDAVATGFMRFEIGTTLTSAGGLLIYSVESNDGVNVQILTGTARFQAVNKAGTVTCAIDALGAESDLSTSGTLTNALTCSVSGVGVTLLANANSSLTPSTFQIHYSIQCLDATCSTFTVP
jgi:hypothetical protein